MPGVNAPKAAGGARVNDRVAGTVPPTVPFSWSAATRSAALDRRLVALDVDRHPLDVMDAEG